MSDERMPKSVAIFILSVLGLGAWGIWGIFNGHQDLVGTAVSIFIEVLGFIAICCIVVLIFEALRSLFSSWS